MNSNIINFPNLKEREISEIEIISERKIADIKLFLTEEEKIVSTFTCRNRFEGILFTEHVDRALKARPKKT